MTLLTPNDTNISSTVERFLLHNEYSMLTIFIICICVIILVFGVVGNCLVVIVFVSKWSLLKTYEVYMINLAVADLIATIIYSSKYLHQTIGGSFHQIAVMGCTAIEFFGTSSVAVSSFTLVIISIDR